MYIYIRYWHTAINFISNARNHQIILVPNAIFISVFKNVEDDNTYSTFILPSVPGTFFSFQKETLITI